MSMSKGRIKLYDVTGRFIIPGTRKIGEYSGRVGAVSPDQAAKDLAPVLHGKFKQDMDRDHKITPGFLRLNLKYREVPPVTPVAPATLDPIPAPLPEGSEGPSGPIGAL